MSGNERFGIIGSGILGMTLAFRVVQKGFKVTLLDSEETAVNLSNPQKMDGIVWDKFYDEVLMSDLHTRRIIREIGLEKDLKWVETKTGFYSGGKLYSLSGIFGFLRIPHINLIRKLRLGLTILDISRRRDWKRLESNLVSYWLQRRSGKRVFEKIWFPLLKSKLGNDVNINISSASFIWAAIQRMSAVKKGGFNKEVFGYVTGGYDRIMSRFTQSLAEIGAEFMYNASVASIRKSEDGSLSVKLQDGQTESFDKVISTIPSDLSVLVAEGLPEWEKQLHLNIRYLGIICPVLILRKPISPYHIINILDEGLPFTRIIEMTALIDKTETNGNNLVYLPKYVNPDDPLFDESEERIKEIFIKAFLNRFPHISESDIVFFCVLKARNVFALPTINYSKTLPDIKTSLDNYFIINSAQIVNGIINMDETIRLAENKLEDVLNS